MRFAQTLLLVVISITIAACGGSSPPNLAPTFSGNSELNTVEGQGSITRLAFTDPEGRTVSQTISGGVDAASFQLTASGLLSFVIDTDFESPGDSTGNNVYQIVVTASDGVNETLQNISINIIDSIEGPFALVEGQQAITSLAYTGPAATSLTQTLTGGADLASVQLSETGELSFVVATDFETPADADGNNSYQISVTTSDGVNQTSRDININVIDAVDGPFAIVEGQQVIANLAFTDPEATLLTQVLVEGADQASLQLSETGELSFVIATDFEAPADTDGNNSYQISVITSDGVNETSRDISINIIDAVDGPFAVVEGLQLIASLGFTDPEAALLTQVLAEGDDQASLQLSETGELSFAIATDFETPADADGNNSYNFSVITSDGVNQTSRAITVTVLNALEGRLIDAPLARSSVFIDADGDFVLDEGERSVITDAEGFFSIQDVEVSCLAPVVCDTQLVAIGGTDIATGTDLDDLLLYGRSLANEAFSITPISTLLMQSNDPQSLLDALGLDLTAEELAAIDPWQLAEDGTQQGTSLLRLNQQVASLMQSAHSLMANNPEVPRADLTLALVAALSGYAESAFTEQQLIIDLTDDLAIQAVFDATVAQLTLSNPIDDAEIRAVAEALALVNIVIADPALDPLGEAAASIVGRVQVDLQEQIELLANDSTSLSEFESATAAETLYVDIPLLDLLPDLDEDGVADIVDSDDDGDGVKDKADAFPRDSSETLDTDGDGQGNNADNDDDGDGSVDSLDPHPLDQTLTPPVAIFTADRISGDAPLEVSFDASESIAGYGDDVIELYAWNFDDGSQANGQQVDHVFNSAGIYTVELILTNSDKLTETASVEIEAIYVPQEFSISGSIAVSESLAVDSDVNDTGSPPIGNNSIASAQLIFNPATVSGYVNAAGDGESGNSYVAGDVDDYFEINALGGEIINLNMSDPSSTDLDLAVFDSSGELVDISLGVTRFESLKLPEEAGIYYINVYVYDRGGSTYLLTVGQDTSLASSGWSTADDFAIGDVIVKQRASATSRTGSYMARQIPAMSTRRAGSTGPTLYSYGNSITQLSPSTKSARAKGVRSDKQLKADTLLAIKKISLQSSVEYAEPNYRRTRQITEPNDERYAVQWHYPKIKLPEAWDIFTGSAEVKVAVIDTGVFNAHPDLADRMSDDGYDFINDLANAGDGDGIDADGDDPGDGRDNPLCGDDSYATSSFHGTHVAGTIGATSDNELGVAGVTWATEIMPLRVLGCQGGYDFDIANAILYAAGLDNQSGIIVEDPADIANMSLGGGGSSNTFANAIADARAAGLIIIAAAGNSSTSSPFYPAAYEGVISVSASNINDELAGYSNYGSTVDVAAPGGEYGDEDGDGYQDLVMSTLARIDGGVVEPTFAGYQGTSMAAPHMAGVVALVKGIYPQLNPEDLDAILLSGNISVDLGDVGRDDDFGHGRIDALKAVNYASQLASGAPIPVTPILSFTNSSLNFGRLATEITFSAYNSGNGSLEISSATASQAYVEIVAPSASDGLGLYTVRIDRSDLEPGIYSDNVVFVSNAGEALLSVIFEVRNPGQIDTGDAGVIYVLLYDVEAGETVNVETLSGAINGTYGFSFNALTGVYNIVAGSDTDNDGLICGPGEACGIYPLPDSPSDVLLNQDLSDIDFGMDFIIPSDANGTLRIPVVK